MSNNNSNTNTLESKGSFARRVLQRTGVRLADIPWGVRQDACLHIMCKRGALLVVAADRYPQQDDEGNPVFTEFLRVDLSKDVEPQDRTCGYCKDNPCSCNGFGGRKGLSRYEDEVTCGYCKGSQYASDRDPFQEGYWVAYSVPCGCDGFGELDRSRSWEQRTTCSCGFKYHSQEGECPACG